MSVLPTVCLLLQLCISALVTWVCYGCDLTHIQQCFGAARDLAPRIYFNPLDANLLRNIKLDFCGYSIEHCMDNKPSDCSVQTLAPYNTIANTVDYICRIDLDAHRVCLGDPELQNAVNHCFTVFQEELENLITNTTLSSQEINTGLCRSYNEAIDCSWYVASSMCSSIPAKEVIDEILVISTDANLQALGCEENAK